MRRFLLLCGAAIIGFSIWYWLSLPVLVETASVQRGPIVEAVYATGIVEPVKWSKVASTETGRIVAYPAEEGMHVKVGEVLAQLDDRKARGTLDELNSRVAFLESELARYEYLVEKNTVSRQTFERVRSDLDRAQALQGVARQRLADLVIRAPLEGIVIRKDGEVGDVVQADDALIWVGSAPPYWITANVDEEDIPRVKPGRQALIKADAFPGTVIIGEVGEITPMGDPVQKQFRVRILLPQDSQLMIGMTTEINIIVRHDDNALLIPERALQGADVWLVDKDRLLRRGVTIGAFAGDLVEIRAGLTEGEVVVLDPPEGLQEGQKVRFEGRS